MRSRASSGYQPNLISFSSLFLVVPYTAHDMTGQGLNVWMDDGFVGGGWRDEILVSGENRRVVCADIFVCSVAAATGFSYRL